MKNGFMFKAIRVVSILVLAVIIALLLITLRPKAKRVSRTETGLLVEVLTAKAEDVNMIIETYGTVEPRETLKLVAEVRGQVVAMNPSFEEGGYIKKGMVLIQIDPRTYSLEVERRNVQISQTKAELKRLQQEVHNLEASIKIAQSDAALAQNDFFRLKKLLGKNVVAQTTLDKAEQRYLASLERLQGLENQMALTGPLKEQLKAQHQMAKVLLRQAELDLERASIVSPFAGWVLEKAVESSQHVNVDQYLGEIYSAGALDIEVRIPTQDLKWLPTNDGQDTAPEAEIFFASVDRHKWKGRVARKKARMDEKTRTLPVVVEVDEGEAAGKNQNNLNLRPGMFVTVKIKGKKVQHAFVLPRDLVHGGDVVYIAQESHLKIRPVRVVRRFKDMVFVDKGLSDGELIIRTPLSGVADGMQIRLKPEVGDSGQGTEDTW